VLNDKTISVFVAFVQLLLFHYFSLPHFLAINIPPPIWSDKKKSQLNHSGVAETVSSSLSTILCRLFPVYTICFHFHFGFSFLIAHTKFERKYDFVVRQTCQNHKIENPFETCMNDAKVSNFQYVASTCMYCKSHICNNILTPKNFQCYSVCFLIHNQNVLVPIVHA